MTIVFMVPYHYIAFLSTLHTAFIAVVSIFVCYKAYLVPTFFSLHCIVIVPIDFLIVDIRNSVCFFFPCRCKYMSSITPLLHLDWTIVNGSASCIYDSKTLFVPKVLCILYSLVNLLADCITGA